MDYEDAKGHEGEPVETDNSKRSGIEEAMRLIAQVWADIEAMNPGMMGVKLGPPVTTGSKLAAALAKARAAFGPLKRTKTVVVKTDKGSYNYSYATLADILESCIPALSANGLSLSAHVEQGPNGALVNVVTLLHESGESRQSRMELPLLRGFRMQELGSALTYSTRYQVSLLLMMAADDDDDGNGADGNAMQTTRDTKAPKGSGSNPASKPQPTPGAGEAPEGVGPVAPDPDEPISEDEAQAFQSAARAAGMKPIDAKSLMKSVAGVDHSSKIPRSRYAALMNEVAKVAAQ